MIELRDQRDVRIHGAGVRDQRPSSVHERLRARFQPWIDARPWQTGQAIESTSSTDIGGTVTVGAGGATIQVANNFFLTFETGSATTLTAI